MSIKNRPGVAACLIASAIAGAIIPQSLRAAVSVGERAAADEAETRGRPPIIVYGAYDKDGNPNANPEAPYKVEKSQNGKFTEKLRDTPKSITAIPKEVIEAIGANSFREVVRTTPGVTLGTGEGGNAFGDRIFIRGFEARNDVYIDGLRDPGVTSREIFAVEQIEIVKGPSGNFGGRGTTGGLVSLESKRPQFESAFVVAEAGVGTDAYRRASADANYAVSDGFALRINAMYQDADTPGRDFVEAEKYGVSAAASLRLTDRLTASADYYFFRLDGIPDFGHPFDGTTQQPYKVDRDNFYGAIGRDFLKNGADIGTIRLEWEPIAELQIRSFARVGKTFNRYIVGTPGAVCRFARTAAGACPSTGVDVGEANYTVSAGGQRRWAENRYVAALTDATARFDTGGLSHTLVIGGEYSRETVENLPLTFPAFVEDSSGAVVFTSGLIRNLLNPNPVLGFSIPVGPDRTNGPTRVRVRSLAAYLIDTIKLTPQVWATLSGRFDTYDIDFRSNATATATILRNRSDFWNWQASLTYKPAEALTFYASFATSANPSGEQIDGNGIAYDGIAPQTANLEPERNRSWEAGAKWETAGGKLLLTAAAFEITKRNARENLGNGIFALVGELRSRGLELGVNGTVFDRLQLFGGYTYTNAKIIESVTLANVGRRFANVPRHSGGLLATWQLGSTIELGGQVYAQSRIFGGTAAAGSANFPGYVRFDAVGRWKPVEWLEARVNVLNLANKRYYDAIYRSGAPFAYIAPGRSATLTLTARY